MTLRLNRTEIDTVNKIGRLVLDSAIPACPVCGGVHVSVGSAEPEKRPDMFPKWLSPSLIISGFLMILVGKKRSSASH